MIHSQILSHRGFHEETERLCKFISSKHDEVACWTKQKEMIENPQLSDKDELDQILLPHDIIWEKKTDSLLVRQLEMARGKEAMA